jgi:hypothetical protein
MRIAILALAAFGAKALYDRYAPKMDDLGARADNVKRIGADLVGDLGDRAKDMTQRITTDAREVASDASRDIDDATEQLRAQAAATTA